MIFEAIKNKQPQEAEKLANQHIINAYKNMVRSRICEWPAGCYQLSEILDYLCCGPAFQIGQILHVYRFEFNPAQLITLFRSETDNPCRFERHGYVIMPDPSS